MKRTKKQSEALIKTLLGIPQRTQILGFYKGIPVLHDPENPAPDGIMYFINEDFTEKFTRKKTPALRS